MMLIGTCGAATASATSRHAAARSASSLATSRRSATPKTTAVTFILSGHKLITVRYDEPRPFTLISNKLARACSATVTGESIMMDLLDAIIETGTFDLGGIKLTYGPAKNQGMDEVFFTILQADGSFKPVTRLTK